MDIDDYEYPLLNHPLVAKAREIDEQIRILRKEQYKLLIAAKENIHELPDGIYSKLKLVLPENIVFHHKKRYKVVHWYITDLGE